MMDGCFHFHVRKQTKQNNNKNSTTVDTSICNTDHVSNLTGMADVNCQEKIEKRKQKIALNVLWI